MEGEAEEYSNITSDSIHTIKRQMNTCSGSPESPTRENTVRWRRDVVLSTTVTVKHRSSTRSGGRYKHYNASLRHGLDLPSIVNSHVNELSALPPCVCALQSNLCLETYTVLNQQCFI